MLLRFILLASLIILPAAANASQLSRVGRKQGCEIAEERMQIYIYREIREKRWEKNLPYRAALMPISITAGFALNYIGQLTYIIPILAPTGFSLTGTDFKALMLENAITFQHIKGSRLDNVDDAVIAFANFDIGMCYYEAEYYAQATAFFGMLTDTRLSKYIGKDNLYFLLGDCYYQLGMLDRSVLNYRNFLLYCRKKDDRVSFVVQRIKTIDAANKKGLWGFERDDQ